MASSLALIEKRNQRTGNACVGIFSQLFDWNKRFTKKKLFPKKLLPPVSVKKASKVFGSDEKQPKLLLIADENSGGFPSLKNNGGIRHVNFETNHGMQVPGLIARLMGLESLPAVKKDKQKKVPKPENSQKCVNRNCIIERGGFGVQNMETKSESRPQKLQKTGLSDKRPLSKLEVEAFESKNVLSRSRKHNHKSLSQARNPGNLSSKSTSILEPGLPSKRSNCAINYTMSSMHNPKIKDHSSEISKDLPQDSYVKSSSCKSFDEQPYADIIVKQMYSDKECHKQDKATILENNVCNKGPSFRVQGERQTFKGRKSLPSRSKLSNLQSNRAPSVNIAKNDTRRSTIVSTKTEYCDSHVRKRGSDHISGKIEPSFSKPSYIRSSLISERDTNDSYHSHILEQPQESASYCTSDRQNTVISSSIKSQIAGIVTELDEKVKNKTCSHEFSSKRSAFHEDGGMENNKHEYFPLDDDNLGALLQEKLRELTSHEEENESVYEDTSSRKTVAVILQELISALTRGKPCNLDYVSDEPPKNPSYFHDRVQTKMTSLTASQHHEHFSPESVLDGSFSNESSNFCEETDHIISSSLFRDSITFLTRHISEALSSIDLANNLLLRGKKLVYAKEIILNAEMAFGNASTTLNEGFSICNLIQNELETIVARFRGLMGSNSNTTENRHHHHHRRNYSQLKGFVFDCVIEYLESRFSRYSNTGFNVWSRLPLRMKTEMLTCEIVEEVGRWIFMSGLSCTELIDYEMSYKLGKWTNFDLEAFETGAEVDNLILESLIDELIVDAYKV